MDYGAERLLRGLAAALLPFAIAALAVTAQAHAKTRQYDLSPAPRWVQPITVEANGRLSRNLREGTAYLLVDRQFRIQDGWSEYQRYVTKVVNPAGVEDASQLTIDFDPKLEHLILHAVRVRRGTRVIDELRHGRIEVLQRESELEQDVLDGSLTFHLLMSDVRVGDIIDVSYTKEHHDSALGNRFFERVTTRWDDPVAHSRLRVLIAGTAPLSFAGTEASAPAKYRKDGWQTLEWNWNSLPGVAADEDAPSWYVQHPAIQFSQFPNWGEVVRTTLPLFSFDARDPELAAVSEQLKSRAETESARALAAVRFVQERVRYTGLELGSGAFRPRSPAEVLRTRYGDCKDKALLAVALLRAMGIDAAPALVSTRWEGHLDEQLPSPGDFDHAIVRLRLAGKTYWIDVTETAQGGVLETLDQADYGKALVISPGVAALEPIPHEVPAQPLITATEVFDLRAGMSAEGSYTVSTLYRGSEADGMRRRLRRTTAAELGERYLNYYKRRYPGVRAAGPLNIHDEPLANEITVNEAYRIARPFESRKRGQRRFEVDSGVIDDYVQPPDQPAREAPLSLDYPVNVAENITIRLPSYFPIKSDVVKIDHTTFHYESRVTHNGNDVLFETSYRSLADHVPRDQFDAYLDKEDEVRQDDSLNFTSNDRASASQRPDQITASATPADEVVAKAIALAKDGHTADADSAISVPPMVTTAISLALAICLGWLVFRYDPTPEQARENAPRGIRGFLLLPAISVTLSPLALLVLLAEWMKLSNLRVWRMLPWIGATSYQPWRHYAYLAILAVICVQLVGSLVSAVLFFRKRSSAPMVSVALMWLGWLVTLGLELFDAALGIRNHSFIRAAGLSCRHFFVVGAWSLYMFGSQRVKATFIARRPVSVGCPNAVE
jgi:transglutaminase-like putative cysteine protease